jgi:hypothetical protein
MPFAARVVFLLMFFVLRENADAQAVALDCPLPNDSSARMTVVDIAKKSEGPKRYYVGFGSKRNETLPLGSHSFVLFGVSGPNDRGRLRKVGRVLTLGIPLFGERVDFEAYSFNALISSDPRERIPAVLQALIPLIPSTVDGQMLPENVLPSQIDQLLILGLDKDQYERAKKKLGEWDYRKYRLGSADCLTVVQEIARELGLETPDRLTSPTPETYISDLKRTVGRPQHVNPPAGASEDWTGYDGPVADGQPFGCGQMRFRDSSTYDGKFRHTRPSGYGIWSFPGKGVYRGRVVAGAPTGDGELRFHDGSLWKGHWSPAGAGTDSGSIPWLRADLEGGTKVEHDGSWQTGTFTNGKLSGAAQIRGADGSAYEGITANGAPSGHGRLRTADGTTCEGNFDNGVLNGHAVCSSPNGEHYNGNFANGHRHDTQAHWKRSDGFYCHMSRWNNGNADVLQRCIDANGSIFVINISTGVAVVDGKATSYARQTSPGRNARPPSLTPILPLVLPVLPSGISGTVTPGRP